MLTAGLENDASFTDASDLQLLGRCQKDVGKK